MFPIKDENPTLAPPVVTYGLIGANVLAWVLIQGMGQSPALEASVCQFGVIPGRLFGSILPGMSVPLGQDVVCRVGEFPAWGTVLSSMFMHGGWLHLIGNMWFLWIFGNNVEDSTGRFRFLVFYVLCGVLAALAQGVTSPESRIPMVGASGAISGVMGAYIVLYPRVRVHMLVFLGIFITRITVPAFWMLGYWFLLQIVSTFAVVERESGGVAFLAHAGGFVAGMVLVLLFRNRELIARRLAHRLPA
ncbi:MAG TPA: rhomboid family intramembrane serine protease [Gemmatimonadales bacterium]|nr:rhomboid family intramembrane serine protease [Gemmatimonadales bacterium]